MELRQRIGVPRVLVVKIGPERTKESACVAKEQAESSFEPGFAVRMRRQMIGDARPVPARLSTDLDRRGIGAPARGRA